MNGLELEQCVRTNDLVKRLFSGIYSIDNIRLPRFTPSFCIVNTDKSDGVGKHWIVLFFSDTRLDTVEIFDSLANKNLPRLLCDSLKAQNIKNVIYNDSNRALQASRSNTCGAHCLFYLYNKCKNGMSLGVLLNEFYLSDPMFNDCMALCTVVKKFIISPQCMKKMLDTTNCKFVK
jgi:hypothetical protein